MVNKQQPQPHRGEKVYTMGKPLVEAAAAMILLHGRGAGAQSILELAKLLPHPDMAYMAPQAAGFVFFRHISRRIAPSSGAVSPLAVWGRPCVWPNSHC